MEGEVVNVHGQAVAQAKLEALIEALVDIENACEQALNSSNPDHWEAGLRDIHDLVLRQTAASLATIGRAAIAEARK